MTTIEEQLSGKNAIELVEFIVRDNPNIAQVSVVAYSHPKPAQTRFPASQTELDAITEAMKLRAATKLPFWDAVLVSLFGKQGDFGELLETAKFHQSLRHREHWIPAANLKNEIQRISSTGPDGQIGICSEVRMEDGTFSHIPMLDFHCPAKGNRNLVCQVCEKLFPDDVAILESGESFHAYGLKLIAADQLTNLLNRSLLFSPIIDRAYVAHQLIEARCVLRLASSETKTTLPRVVAARKGEAKF